MRFNKLDLNLLVALNVLLEERSVSGAAKRLYLSQPAMSAALKRLREYFKDDLLLVSGKRMVPTPHAMQLEPQLKLALQGLESLILQSTLFEEQFSTRTFLIAASDYVASILIAPLLQRLQTAAPSVKFEISPPSDSTNQLIEQGKIDLAILPQATLSKDHPSELLFEERFVLVGCAKNPLFDKPISEADFYAASHVIVKIGQLRPRSIAETEFSSRGINRKEDVRISSFLLAPEMVINSNRLTVMHERLAKKFAKIMPVRIAKMPFEMNTMSEYLQFNQAREMDLGLKWLIKEVKSQIYIEESDGFQ